MGYMTEEILEDTLRFQDFATDALYDRGISINAYSSRKWNMEKGESRSRNRN